MLPYFPTIPVVTCTAHLSNIAAEKAGSRLVDGEPMNLGWQQDFVRGVIHGFMEYKNDVGKAIRHKLHGMIEHPIGYYVGYEYGQLLCENSMTAVPTSVGVMHRQYNDDLDL